MKRCGSCKYRDENGHCVREDKIHEEEPSEDRRNQGMDVPANDHLIYSYYEGGSFWVGQSFGCVHHEEKKS